jgi:cephalosporin-C deacetylase
MKRSLLLLLCFIALYSIQAQNVLPEKWKFHTGDNIIWSTAGFDDSKWSDIDPMMIWERQQILDYNGYAWYRATFVIPSSMKVKAMKYGGFMLHLGKIDDADITWFNGKEIGRMGVFPPAYESAWADQRQYPISVDMILWDQPNTIAVKVFDSIGGGGLYDGPVELSLLGLVENLSIEPAFPQKDFILKETDKKEIPFQVQNKLSFAIKGNLKVEIFSDFGESISTQSLEISLPRKKTQHFSFPITDIQPGFYKVKVSFTNEEVVRKSTFNFGYEPEKIISPMNRQEDFDDYWKRAKKELAAVDPQYKITRMDSLCTDRRNVYLVEMRSLGNVLIRAWYSVPAKAGRYPAVLLVQGYSSVILPEYADYGDDIIGLGLNIRGHGNSRDNVNPGFPGYLLDQIGDKEQYIYRGAYMDCVRAIDFLFSRPEVDINRVGVEGGSQGGALTFATAALNNDRIAVCVPLVPFLSDFEDYFKVAVWPADEFNDFVDVQKKMSWEKIFYTLSYIDIKNLAPMIKAPMLMGVGLVDETCPPHINFAAYNQVRSEKQYIVYPHAGHGLPQDMDIRKMAFIREKFGLIKETK